MINVPEQFTVWASAAAEFGFTDFMSAEDGFRTCLSTGGAWTNAHACGIYFWVAENGETYVGQTVNARARLREHWRTHPDISYACFQPVASDKLNEVEKRLIQVVGRDFRTRNIKHALDTRTHVPFDDFALVSEHKGFLNVSLNLPDHEWRDLPVLKQKQTAKFNRFIAQTDSRQALNALGTFVDRVIPRPARTEARFWSVSMFVQSHMLRINGGQQEIFTVMRDGDGLLARMLSASRLSYWSEGPIYETQSWESVVAVECLADWLTGRRLLACRRLVVQLMRHTTTLNSGSHCPQVVRAAPPERLRQVHR